MTAVGTPAVDVVCGIPPPWRLSRGRHLTPEGARRGGPPHEARDDSLPFPGFIPLLVGRGLGAKAPGPLGFGRLHIQAQSLRRQFWLDWT